MINSKFGTPDPDWDYNYIWTNLVEAHTKLKSLIAFVTELENCNPEDEAAIAAKLQSIQSNLSEANKACTLPPLDNLL